MIRKIRHDEIWGLYNIEKCGMAFPIILFTTLLIQLSKCAPQTHVTEGYTQPSFKWAFSQSYSWTYIPNTAQLPHEQQIAAVPAPQLPTRPVYFQNNQRTPNTNTNQINSGFPMVRVPSNNERFRENAPVNSYNGELPSEQHNNGPILPVVNSHTVSHDSNDYSQTVAEPSDTTTEAGIQAIVQRVIAEVTKNNSIRQSTNNHELEQIIRRILNEQHQISNVQKVSSSAAKLRQSYPSNGEINSYSNRVSTEPQQENNFLKSLPQLSSAQCFQNGQCDTATPLLAISAANSMVGPLGTRQMVNAMSYTSV